MGHIYIHIQELWVCVIEEEFCSGWFALMLADVVGYQKISKEFSTLTSDGHAVPTFAWLLTKNLKPAMPTQAQS